MTDVLSGLGLAPASIDEPGTATDADLVEPGAPAAPVAPVAPAAPAPAPAALEAEPEIVVPEGAQNPDAVKNAIAAERKAAREANARARDLEAQLRQRQEDALPLEQRISAAESRATEADIRATRIEIGVSKGLSIAQCKRLSGSTAEDIAADAEAFAAELGTSGATPSPVPAPVALPDTGAGYQAPAPAAKVAADVAHNDFLLGIIGKQ